MFRAFFSLDECFTRLPDTKTLDKQTQRVVGRLAATTRILEPTSPFRLHPTSQPIPKSSPKPHKPAKPSHPITSNLPSHESLGLPAFPSIIESRLPERCVQDSYGLNGKPLTVSSSPFKHNSLPGARAIPRCVTKASVTPPSLSGCRCPRRKPRTPRPIPVA